MDARTTVTTKGYEELNNTEKAYGLKFGTFSWVRGEILIYDLDDIEYVRKCLIKIKHRIEEEKQNK